MKDREEERRRRGGMTVEEEIVMENVSCPFRKCDRWSEKDDRTPFRPAPGTSAKEMKKTSILFDMERSF